MGEDLSLDLCNSKDAIPYSYENGVPMGGTLDSNNISNARIFVSASADQSQEDQFIEKLQVIKGVVRDGMVETSIHDIKSNESSDLDLNSCKVNGNGVRSMCAVWEDPNFNQGDEAYYYVRVIANKSCRWSHNLCIKNPKYCEDEKSLDVPKFIQERAWTSPIWLENLQDI